MLVIEADSELEAVEVTVKEADEDRLLLTEEEIVLVRVEVALLD